MQSLRRFISRDPRGQTGSPARCADGSRASAAGGGDGYRAGRAWVDVEQGIERTSVNTFVKTDAGMNSNHKIQTYRVLVVDDDPVFSGVAAAALGRTGFQVRTAADGVEGLELLDRHRFDLSIIDLQMPRIDGLRLVALIRGAARNRRLAIIVASAHTDENVFDEALALGADAIEKKPVNWGLLPDRARQIIEKRRADFPSGA